MQSDKEQHKIITSKKVIVFFTILFALASVVFCYIVKRPRFIWSNIPGGMTEELMDSELYEDLQSGRSVCFIGDSITYGYHTLWGCWYTPLLPYTEGRVSNVSFHGWTSGMFMNHTEKIPVADIYIIAVGINDVKFPDENYGADTPEEYIDNLQAIYDYILTISPYAKTYFIAPWVLIDHPGDIIERRADFANALMEWCEGTRRISLDPGPIIMSVIEQEDSSSYMVDQYHPNYYRGVGLYSYAVLYQDHQRRINT